MPDLRVFTEQEVAVAKRLYCYPYEPGDVSSWDYLTDEEKGAYLSMVAFALTPLAAREKQLREALEFYAHGIGFTERQDDGAVARAALEALNGGVDA